MHFSFAGSEFPNGVAVVITGNDTAVVLWTPATFMTCDFLIVEYSVKSWLTNGTGGYTTVNTLGTNVVLRGLMPNAEYSVSVVAIDSNGDTSAFSASTLFNVTPATKASKTVFKLHHNLLTLPNDCSAVLI